MHSFRLDDLHTHRWAQHHRAYVHRGHAGDVAEGAMEFLCVVVLLLAVSWRPRLTCATMSDRLENEHLGNIDQYRVTREVPLPYHFDTHSNEEEEEHEEESPGAPSWLKRRTARF